MSLTFKHIIMGSAFA